ncbi:MAG: glycine--tRNA ligase subunit beta [Gammaproteobacteria bacterium]|nr:glycine--tRNA ligase subunit beta [Gammaproteobacteria bacterium]
MPAHADFLVEIGTEELPPKALRDLELAFRDGVVSRLNAANLGGAEARSFATPRRLAVLVPDLAVEQAAQRVEKRGPPLKVAFDAAGQPTRAALAFAQTCAVEVDALEKLETPAGSWLVFRGESAGKAAADILPGLVAEALAGLPVPRRMRWGNREVEFVRPVHWLVMLLGEAVVPAEILGLQAGRHTRGHRFMSTGAIELRSPADYPSALRGAGCVIADFIERRGMVRELAMSAGRQLGGEAVTEDAVLDEVTSLVEWPVAVTGRFDPAYLDLPEEVLMATLQGHQRYFPMRGADGRLLPNFITISNLRSSDPAQVQLGNERVVKPRLADASFFWTQDLRKPLAERAPALADIVFQRGLGSLKDKSSRMAALGVQIAGRLGAAPDAVERAAFLAKADLLTDMVKEFPELQGRMGYYYALRNGEPDAVAMAIEEQYLPRHAGDRLATTGPGRCLALAERLDTLAGAFALGKRPSGNKDPFGLRRAALGLVRTLIEGGIELPLPEFIASALALQPAKAADPRSIGQDLYDFIIERLRAWYLEGQAPGIRAGQVTAEMFEAVRLRAPASPLDFHARLLAVRSFMEMDEAPGLAIANKRIANILRTATGVDPALVDPALFETTEERQLHAALEALLPVHQAGLVDRRYGEVLQRLAGLRDPLDAFFSAVMVMSEDAALRQNRLALLQDLRQLFLDVADLSCLNVT